MNKNEFIEEVCQSSIMPTDFQNMYKEFSEYQKLAYDTLIEFCRVCDKNNIEYQLAFGSLLGAVRDEGQIPWDYDIDVFVKIEDKERLVLALERDLSDSYYYYCPENNARCRHYIMRLAPKGYKTEALHVDVFYLIGLPEDKGEREVIKERISKLSYARFYKLVNIKEEAAEDVVLGVKYAIRKIQNLFIPLSKIDKEYKSLAYMYPLQKAKFCTTADTGSNLCEFETKLILNTKVVRIANDFFRIPVMYEEVLQSLYGDYKKIMPLQKRLEEIIRSYKHLKKRAKE